MMFLHGKVPGPRRVGYFCWACQRCLHLPYATRAGLIAQSLCIDQVAGGRHAQRRTEINFVRNQSISKYFFAIAFAGVLRYAPMAVLHITYKYNRDTSQADYDGFYKVMTSYRCRRLSESNWTINTEQPPEAVWQKLKHYIDPNDYFLMLPLDPISFSPMDQTVLSWLAARP
jgi:hypothetical protein